MWKHIDFYFKGDFKDADKYLNPKEQVMFENCLARIIVLCKPYISRKFYLYEPKPHCFLALEIKHEVHYRYIRQVVKDCIKEYNFIKSAKLNLKSGDDSCNGEDFLMILDAFTEAYLFHRKGRLTHIVHCCMEFMHQTRASELNFYKVMLALYGGLEYK